MLRNLTVSTALAICLCLCNTGCQSQSNVSPAQPGGTNWEQIVDDADVEATPDVPDLPDDFRG